MCCQYEQSAPLFQFWEYVISTTIGPPNSPFSRATFANCRHSCKNRPVENEQYRGGNQPRGDKQPPLIESLLRPRAYPHPVSKIELLETHISWVILTGEFAYKIKKPVTLSFLDFGTLEQRKHFCEEELRLNRKWAPKLYLDVVPICGSAETPTMGGDNAVIEYALKMLQFPQSARLDAQLDAGLLSDDDMYELAEKVAGYHRDAKSLDYVSDKDALERVTSPVRENFLYVRPHIEIETLQAIEDGTENALHRLESQLIDRQKSGYVRECHGDLHLANLVRLSSGIAAFDCVEFSADLRNIDVISDVAFLAMDLVSRARQDLAYIFVNRYLECSGDYAGMDMYGLYFVYHCMIRAKVAAIRCTERTEEEGREHDRQEVGHYCEVALDWINRPAPTLIAMHGFSASGKTWLSTRLMAQLPAIRVRSDTERKRLFDLEETADSHSTVGQGIYTDRARGDVYQTMFDVAERLLRSGYNVILDASFLQRGNRDAARALTAKLDVAFVIVDTVAAREELLRRLTGRKSGDDPSEADTDVLRHQFENSDPLEALELRGTVCVTTDTGFKLDDVVDAIVRCGHS